MIEQLIPRLEPQQHLPPEYCQCAGGRCDQSFESIEAKQGLVLYPSKPEQIASAIESGVLLLSRQTGGRWITWKDLRTAGQVIFCEICKSIRGADVVVLDVTTLNLNLLFEIGFAVGLNKPVIPIRDCSWEKDRALFEQLGLLDTIGYVDFTNSNELAERLLDRVDTAQPIPAPGINPETSHSIYVIKGHLETEGELRLMSLLKKSPLRFRTYDVIETPRLSLHEARKQVALSDAIVAHLLSPERAGAAVHNARCALIAGIATATGRVVLLLQEGDAPQPIDYRDVVHPYLKPEYLERALEPFIRTVVQRLQDSTARAPGAPRRFLERLDLGDVAAENEIESLRSYFVRTAQYNEARRGAGRLVIGRKGSGKSAMFYSVRDAIPRGHSHLVLDLKPEGYQFTRLREEVLEKLSTGLQEHTLTAFWEFIILCEMAQKIIDYDYNWAQRDDARRKGFEDILELYGQYPAADAGDFSERLLRQVETIARATEKDFQELVSTGRLTEMLFEEDIQKFRGVLSPYLRMKEEVWVLIDNLDKGWPTRGASNIDIMILRTLLDATRKMQRDLERDHVGFRLLVCLRNDIYDQLLDQTPDKGKDTAIFLNWDDPQFFQEIIRRRLVTNLGNDREFSELWGVVAETHVGVQDSFQYILDRTMMRPRDLLLFLRRAIETAVNRGHKKVSGDDIRTAEAGYSEDMLVSLSFELREVFPRSDDLFIRSLDVRQKWNETRWASVYWTREFQKMTMTG